MNQNLLINATGLLLLLFPAMLMAVPDGGSATLVLLLLVSITGLFLNKNPIVLDKNEKYLLATIAVYMAVYIFNVWFFNSEISELDNTSRFLLLLPIFFYIRRLKLTPNYIYYGILMGAVACLVIAAYQKFFLGFDQASGVTSIVSFGTLSMTLAMMCFIIALLCKSWSSRILFYSGFMFAAYASVLSGSRGAWLILLSCLLILFITNPLKWPFKTRFSAILVSLILITASYFFPPVQHRVNTAINEIDAYFTYDVVNTSVGARLEIWRASVIAATENPILGIGEGNFSNKMKQLSDQGLVDPFVLNIAHVHNEYISALLHRSLPGLLSLLLLFLIPLIAFSKTFIAEQGDRRMLPAIGVILVISTMTISLTDVFFYQHKNTLFYVAFTYILYASMRSDTRMCR